MADETANLTLEILKRIQSDLAGVHREVGGLRGEVGHLRGEVDGLRGEFRSEVGELRAEMREGFNDAAARDAALDARISRLDAETTRGFQLVLQELRGHRSFATDTLREHENRIRRLEEYAFPPKSS